MKQIKYDEEQRDNYQRSRKSDVRHIEQARTDKTDSEDIELTIANKVSIAESK